MVRDFVHLLHRLFLHFPQVKNVFRMMECILKLLTSKLNEKTDKMCTGKKPHIRSEVKL